MRQLSLFDALPRAGTAGTVRRPLDAASEELLLAFRTGREAEGARPRTIDREVSQLRSTAREGGGPAGPTPLATLFVDLRSVARVLCEPAHPVSRSTGLARLLAAQRFVRIIGPLLGRDPTADLEALDSLLPARSQSGWHTAGTLVAGAIGRRRRRGPTLGALELHKLVEAAGDPADGPRAARNRALVALHCFSGLRPEEVLRLQWEDLTVAATGAGRDRLTVDVERGDRRVRLAILHPAAEALTLLAQAMGSALTSLSGPVIAVRAGEGQPLGYRAARDIVRAACRRVGLPPAESADLRAAFAHWLRTQGVSDHEVATVLGVARVRTVDRLLRRHQALDAQRSVREVLSR